MFSMPNAIMPAVPVIDATVRTKLVKIFNPIASKKGPGPGVTLYGTRDSWGQSLVTTTKSRSLVESCHVFPAYVTDQRITGLIGTVAGVGSASFWWV